MYARVYVEQLTVIQQTPNDDRDEIYFMVSGQSQAGRINEPRIPKPPQEYDDNDYYGLHAGESAYDSPAHRITLWEGWIDYNQLVSLATVVREQDGAPFVELILSLPSIAGNILTGNIGGALDDITTLAAAIVDAAASDHHETVGAFTLVIDHQTYQPTFTWNATAGVSAIQSNGALPMAEFSCTGSDANYLVRTAIQQWMQMDVKHSGMALDVRAGSLNAGAPIQQFRWNGGDNQLWEIIPVDGPYVRVVSKRSGLCLDVADASQADGAPVIQFPWHGGYNQQWKIEPLADGWSRIVNRDSNKCLDVRGASMQSQASVQQFACQNQDNQLWRLW
jgi:hypothetical protein